MNERNDVDERSERILDAALDEIRGERPDAEFERAATARTWERLRVELEARPASRAGAGPITSCADFQGLLPAYLAGERAPARMLLLEDHLGECVPCRRELRRRREVVGLRARAVARTAAGSRAAAWAWRLAAAAAVFVAVVGFSFETELFSIESGGSVRIEALEGDLFHVTEDGAVPLAVGDEVTLDSGEGLRTAMGSSAILSLADASRVEMRQRSQLAVRERSHWLPGRRPEGLLDLERGSIIVEASDQGAGHLFVDTEDCNVAVQGTVFAVTAGTKGSRVSVVEGEVEVRYGGQESVLHPGDQTTTHDGLRPVPVEQDVAWSRNSERYVELLREMRVLGRELEEVLAPGLRYETDLLDIAPAGTAVYFAMPNISDELAEAYKLLQDRMATSVVLRNWWQEHVLAAGEGREIEKILEKVRGFGDTLGAELVMTLQTGPGGDVVGPLFLARLTDAAGFRRQLADEIAALEARQGGPVLMRLLDDRPAAIDLHVAAEELLFWTRDDVLAVTPNPESLAALEAGLAGQTGATLSGSAFHDRLHEHYRDGVEWIVGADIERLTRLDGAEVERLDDTGLSDVRLFIGERKQEDGRTENRAVLTFDGPRRHLAAWLAEPAPLGALDYVGPDANLAAGFVMQDMGVIVDELLDLLATDSPGFEASLAEFEQGQGIDVRRDIANPLGGEVVVALDGPTLPTPSWKVVLEVYDPERLQRTLGWFVDAMNREMDGRERLALTREVHGGRDYFRLESESGFALHYVFDGSYLVAGPSRGLLERALQHRAAGVRLTDSRSFLELLPRDAEVDFSGFVYQNLAPILDPLSGTLESLGGMPDEQRQLVQALAAEARPSLALLYGRPDRITLASAAEGGLFSSLFSQLSGATKLLSMQQSVARAVEARSRDGN